MNHSEYIDTFQTVIKKFGIEPSEEVTALFFQNLEPKVFKKGEIILKPGEICNEAYFIVKGLVRSYNILPNGTEKTYIICRDLNLFSEHSSFMSQKPSTDYLEAIEETVILYISYANLNGLYEKYHLWAMIGRKISDLNYVTSMERLKSLMNDDAEKRYKRFLKSFHNILHRIPQNVAASYLGITPQSFSRLKREINPIFETQNILNNKQVDVQPRETSKNNSNLTAQELIAFYDHLKSMGSNPSIDDLSLILPYMRKRKFKKGEVFLKAGEICRDYFFSIEGMARCFCQLPNGTEKTYFIIPEYTIFADQASLISKTPATENYEAIEPMEVFCLNYEGYIQLSKNHHAWEIIGRIVSDTSFVFSQKRLRSMMNEDALTRYQKFMKYYKDKIDRIPQQVIASYLGITPQSFSRLKKGIEEL